MGPFYIFSDRNKRPLPKLWFWFSHMNFLFAIVSLIFQTQDCCTRFGLIVINHGFFIWHCFLQTQDHWTSLGFEGSHTWLLYRPLFLDLWNTRLLFLCTLDKLWFWLFSHRGVVFILRTAVFAVRGYVKPRVTAAMAMTVRCTDWRSVLTCSTSSVSMKCMRVGRR